MFAKYAKEYWQLGFNVIPVAKGTKHMPAIQFREYETRHQTEDEINKWIEQFPEYNIAIMTGKISNLAVIDLDGETAVTATKGILKPTWIVETQRGFHYYYRPPKGVVIRNATNVLPGVDIRGEGGFVIAPGSIHASGKEYTWYFREGEIVDAFPVSLINGKVNKNLEAIKKEMTDWIDIAKQGVESGKRNDVCARLSGYYIGKGYAITDVIDLMQAWNLKNTPPLDSDEVSRTVNSIAQKEIASNPCINTGDAKVISLVDAKVVIRKWMYYKDEDIIDVALAVMATTLSEADSLWIMFVGGAGVGKTEILRGFKSHPDACFLDNVTPASFATGFVKAKGLLELMNGCKKTMIFQDFSTIMSKPSFDCNEILDALRQIYNGRYEHSWGSGKKVSWEGKFNMLTASTPAIEGREGLMAELGERFLYYRIPSDDEETRAKMNEKSSLMCGSEKLARDEISMALLGVLKGLEDIDPDSITIDETVSKHTETLADLTTRMRTPVKRNYMRQSIIEYAPNIEGPGRVNKAVRGLMRGVAMVRGKKECDLRDYEVAIKICVDSIPSIRRQVIRSLLKNHGRGYLRPKDMVKETCYVSTETVGYKLDDLAAVGVCERQDQTNEVTGMFNQNASWLYAIKDEIVEKMKQCGMYYII